MVLLRRLMYRRCGRSVAFRRRIKSSDGDVGFYEKIRPSWRFVWRKMRSLLDKTETSSALLFPYIRGMSSRPSRAIRLFLSPADLAQRSGNETFLKNGISHWFWAIPVFISILSMIYKRSLLALIGRLLYECLYRRNGKWARTIKEFWPCALAV